MKSCFRCLMLCAMLGCSLMGLTAQSTTLDVINKTSETINFAYAEQNYINDMWTSHGWWTVKPGKKITITLPEMINGTIYTYAIGTTTKGFWGKDKKFAVIKGKKFNIPMADNPEVEGEQILFNRWVVKLGEGNTLSYKPGK